MSTPENSSPLRKIVCIRANPGMVEAMRAALLDLEEATRTEPGCREFRFFQALSEADTFLLIEEFADAAALATHMALPHTQAFFARKLAASIAPVEYGQPA